MRLATFRRVASCEEAQSWTSASAFDLRDPNFTLGPLPNNGSANSL